MSVCLSVCLSLCHKLWGIILVLITFPKLNSSVSRIFRVIPGGFFFLCAQFWFLGPAGTGNIFGAKICGERSVCPMVTKLSGFGQYLGRNLMKVENLDFGHGIVLFWYWKPFWDQILGQHILSLWHFLSWTLVFLESLGLSPGGIFFLVQFWFLGPAGTGNLFGTKICRGRSVCPMVTKLSGFGQYLGRNLMKVEILDFVHGIVLFWYWKPFWNQNLRREIRLSNGDQTFRIWSVSR